MSLGYSVNEGEEILKTNVVSSNGGKRQWEGVSITWDDTLGVKTNNDFNLLKHQFYPQVARGTEKPSTLEMKPLTSDHLSKMLFTHTRFTLKLIRSGKDSHEQTNQNRKRLPSYLNYFLAYSDCCFKSTNVGKLCVRHDHAFVVSPVSRDCINAPSFSSAILCTFSQCARTKTNLYCPLLLVIEFFLIHMLGEPSLDCLSGIRELDIANSYTIFKLLTM